MHPQLRAVTEDSTCKRCDACKRNSLFLGPLYGYLPTQVAKPLTWQEVAIYLICPWLVHLHNNEH
jgi:hypothetical protein